MHSPIRRLCISAAQLRQFFFMPLFTVLLLPWMDIRHYGITAQQLFHDAFSFYIATIC
jgi:hypothetical protein